MVRHGKHIHRFIRIPATTTFTWKCMDCKFFVHMGLSHVLLGKTAICWGCENEFIMTELAMMEDKPRCEECRVGTVDDVERFLEMQRQKKIAADKLAAEQAIDKPETEE